MDDFNMNMNNMRNRWKPRKPKIGESGKENSGGRGSRSGLRLWRPRTAPIRSRSRSRRYLPHSGMPKAVTETGLHFKIPLIQSSAEGKYDNTGLTHRISAGYQRSGLQ